MAGCPMSLDVGARLSSSNRDPTFEKVGHPSTQQENANGR